MTDEDRIYRRDPPHWRRADSIYFVTWRVTAARRFLVPAERGVVSSTLGHFDGLRYDLLAYAVTDDHVHVVVGPRLIALERIVHSWKSFTTGAIGGGRVWQPEYQDRIVRDDAELIRIVRYVLNNPDRRWPGARTYPFVWAITDFS